MEGDEAVAERPPVHRFLQDHLLLENYHIDVVELTQPLQDLGHGLGLGLLHHCTDADHDLAL